MTAYFELSVMRHAVFAFFALLLTFAAIFLCVCIVMLHMKRKFTLCGATLTFAALFINQGVADVSNSISEGIKGPTLCGKAIGSLSYAAVIALFALIAAAEILLFAAYLRQRKNLLTESAIKESLDSLPDGVCFYASDGAPLLVNRQMQLISSELFDSEIMNVNLFISRLIKGDAKAAKIISTEPYVIAETPDKKVWNFRLGALNDGKTRLHELIAFDITEQYRLNAELIRRNERLSRVNERLRRFSDEAVTFTAEKELLKAKLEIHDNIGRSLLACRAYFSQNAEKRSRKDLLFMWRYVFSVMKKETLPSDEWELTEKAADMLGVSIELSGKLPDNMKIRAAVITAIRECLTNTASHACGDRLFVKISEDNRSVTAELTNAGKPPKGVIQEKGGLKNLRRIAERAGGSMTIESVPRFLLRLEFQKESKANG